MINKEPISGHDLPKTLSEASALLHGQKLSVKELVQTYLKRIELLNSKLNAIITVTAEDALQKADALDDEIRKGRSRGLLHGIPLVYKDNIDKKNVRATMGSQYFSNRIADNNAHVADKLEDAGAILLGKANMNEFAAGVAGYNKFFGNTYNPWNLSRWSGGSSSGTGVAISAGLCLGGLGTDTGISIRGPSGWLGLVGLRPSYGRISVRGTFPRAYSFDTVGPMARSVTDVAILLQALEGYDKLDPFAVQCPGIGKNLMANLEAGVKGIRIGVVDNFTFANIDPEIDKALQSSIQTLENLGAVIKHIRIPLFSDKERLDRIDAKSPLTILLYEFNKIIGSTFDQASDQSLFGDVVHNNIRDGRKISDDAYHAAINQRAKQIAEIRTVFDDVDAFLTPTHPFVAPLQTVEAEADINVRQFTVPISFTGFPALSIPCGFNSEKLPIGMQIIANDFQEETLLQIAKAFESATNFLDKWPPIVSHMRDS